MRASLLLFQIIYFRRLNPITVGKGAVLKSSTRLLSGSSMECRSMLLEHTLVLAGETVESGTVWQGWPSDSQKSLNSHRSRVKALLDKSLRFRSSTNLPTEKMRNNSSENALMNRVFFDNKMGSVRWNQEKNDARASGEKVPLLKEEDVRHYPHMLEMEMV